MLVELERRACVHAQRLENGTAAQHALVVGVQKRRVDGHDAATELGERNERHATGVAIRRADRREQRTGLDPRLLDLVERIGVPDDAASDPEMDRVVGDGEGANRECQVDVAVRVDAPERAHRRAATDRLECGDHAERAIFGQPVTDPPGSTASRSSVRPTSSRSSASTVATRCVTPASSRSASSSGQRTVPARATRARSFRSRSTIITCSAASFADSTGTPAGRVPLIGEVRIREPRRESRSSGDAETIVQPSPSNGSGSSGRSGASAPQAPRDRRRTPRSDAARGSPDRRRPRRSPRARRRPPPRSRAHSTSRATRRPRNARRAARRLEGVRDSGQAARLGRRRRTRPAQRIGSAVADEHPRDRVLADEEPVGSERRLELGERVELDRHPPIACATCRSQSTPSSRSAAGTRSSAEWISVAASCGAIVRYGKKP